MTVGLDKAISQLDAAAALGLSAADVDELFELAATL